MKNNLIFETYFPFLFEKNYNELSFLNNKRMANNSEKYYSDLHILNDNIYNKKSILKNEFNTKKNQIFKICKDFSKLKFINYSNFNKINRNKNYYDNNNLYEIENRDYIFINNSNVKKNKLNKSKINKDINELKNTINICSNEMISDINKKDNLNKNEIRVKKNNKFVYMNKLLIKTKIKPKEIIFEKKRRSSRYRGVSKNGSKWQVIISSKYNKGYIGNYETQEIAARVYDIISIKNKGIKARTNYEYNIHQIQKINEEYIDFKSKNIDEIILQLINE